MKKHTVKIDPDALNDIQEITNWYNDQQKSLGGRFQKTAIQQTTPLRKTLIFMPFDTTRSGACQLRNSRTWPISSLTMKMTPSKSWL